MIRLLALFVLALAPALSIAQPILLSHHGYLLDGSNKPVDGEREITLRLYATEFGSEAVWFESYTVILSEGRYGVLLGETKGAKKPLLSADVAGDRWLGVAVAGADLTPHLRLGAVPRAVTATDAGALGGVAAAKYALKAESAALAGATFTGPVALAGAPTAANQAATKGYVDGEIGLTRAYVDAQVAAASPQGYAQLSGATFTGPVALAADPTALLGAATKQYVDALNPKLTQAEGNISTLQSNVATLQTNVSALTTNVTAVNTTQSENIAALQAQVAGLFPLNAATTTRKDCKAILAAGESKGSGIYYIHPDATTYTAHCDMTTQDGGWTLVMNVNPADGSNVSFTNTPFWKNETEYGEMGAHFTNDYKGPAAWEVVGTGLMIQIAKPGPVGRVIGWKAWSMPVRSFDSFFDVADNTTITTGVLGSETSKVYAYEALIKNGANLVANRNINSNADRVRLAATGYTAQGDDNQAGLGTQMNEAICGAGNNCYRFRDVELWVNSNANVWDIPATAGTFGWIGNDGGCGASCNDAEQNKNGQYPELWTYHLYVR